MYSILLVDDEKSIRDYLPKAIPFEQYGFSIQDTAINGLDALKKLPEVRPDLILLDVRMPDMDGLQFLKTLRQGEFANTMVVMLSGYSDFTCAKEAMKYDVKAYLNKPVDEDEIIPLLIKMHDIIEQDHNEQKIGLIREKANILYALYNGGKGERGEFSEYVLMTCVLLDNSNINGKGSPNTLLQEYLLNYLCELDSCLFLSKGNQYTFLLSLKLFTPFHHCKEAFAEELLDILEREGFYCSILFDSYIFENEENSFREDFSNHSYEMLTQVFYSSARILNYLPGCFAMCEVLDMEAKYLEGIRQHVSLLNKEELCKSMKEIYIEIQRVRLGVPYVQEFSFRIYYLILIEISQTAHEGKIEQDIKRPEWMDKPHFLTFEKWKERQTALILEGLSLIEQKRQMKNLGIIRDILNYIHSHYMEQINLKLVSEIFFMNTAYLGRTFRKTIGVSFKQYVNKMRIKEAKKLLLRTDKLIYEIANQVGYTESKYFIAKFTQEVGRSPTEYRNKMDE